MHGWPFAPSRSERSGVRDSHLTERIRLLERRLRQAAPDELTDDDRAALAALLEAVRELARPQPCGPGDAGPHGVHG